VSARFVNSLPWWQGLAVLVGLVVLLGSLTPLVASAEQEGGESVPVVAIARTGVSSSASSGNRTDRASTSKAAAMILVADTFQSARDQVSPRVVSNRSVLDVSSSFRC